MSKRKARDREWELHKDAILELYIAQDSSLSEVIAAMAAQGFSRTKSQYEGIFKRWGVSKNLKRHEWMHIVRALHGRERQGKETQFRVRGALISRETIRKQRRIHEYQSTFDRVNSKLHPRDRFTSPVDVEMFTPAASPKLSPHTGPVVPEWTMHPTVSAWTAKTPWNLFQNHSLNLLLFKGDGFVINRHGTAQVQICLRSESNGGQCSKTLIISGFKAYLPTTQPATSSHQFDPTIKPMSKDLVDQVLASLVGMVSNNLNVDTAAPIIVQLARSPSFCAAFRDFLACKRDTTDALAEKLLLPAVRYDNLELLKVLVESNVDVDLCSATGNGCEPITALQCAVEKKNIRIVDYLLKKGAKNWNVKSPHGSILDLAVEVNHLPIFRRLTNRTGHERIDLPPASIRTLRRAILLGQPENVDLLLKTQPKLLYAARTSPWLFFEALAAGRAENFDLMIGLLARHGLSVTAIDSRGRGSMLAAASWAPNMSLINKLLGTNCQINRKAVGVDPTIVLNQYPAGLDRGLGRIRGKTALHVAIKCGHASLVETLLKHGANVHQNCHLLPIQAAAYKGNFSIVLMLVMAGADINDVAQGPSSRIKKRSSRKKDNIASLTAFRIALIKGHMHIAEMLYVAGATLLLSTRDAPDSQDWGDLWWEIATYGSEQLVLALASEWAITDDDRMPPECIGRCAQRFGMAFVKDLVRLGVAASDTETYTGIIHAAICKQDERLLKDIISLFAQTDGVPRCHVVGAFIEAVAREHRGIIDMFLRAGIDPFELVSTTDVGKWVQLSTRFRQSESAFLRSMHASNITIARDFLEIQGSVPLEERPHSHREQMCEAYTIAFCVGDTEQLHMLSDHGVSAEGVCDIMGPDYIKQQLYIDLVECIERGWLGKAERLLRLGASPTKPQSTSTPENHTVLQLLARADNVALFKKFLDLGESVHTPPIVERGATALQFAASNGNFDIVNMTIAAGANVNAAPAEYDGRSAIEGAAEWGRLDMVHALLEAGAMVQGRDNVNYRRAVYRAWTEGHRTLVGVIQRWKREHYGEQDCEEPEVIVQSMTDDELDFRDEDAKLSYGSRHDQVTELGPRTSIREL